ncbi:hypothetical protein AMK59_7466 [Oryctes borbonicus]|uniref:CFAP74 fourth Ig-like domain-containing protein n=1 Tax=Oryctes borbonicus TaxID=1629725 RepID=A0A0T6AXK8_9SCAR|nr:hypothetical protein AMK59_7466 [Oryctes borbonicus]
MVDALRTSGGTTTATPVIKDNSLVIIRDLNIYEGGYLQKVFFFFYIKFGNVYIGDTAKSILTLRNLTCPAMKFEVYKCHKFREFVVSPETGYIPSVRSGGTCTIDVFFTPTEPENYEEWIAVTTTITHHYVIINVCGNGTYDEKYHVSGLH